MKYRTVDELEQFNFNEAYIAEAELVNGNFVMTLDNVTILPDNTCNRDIREMRTNNLVFKIQDGKITSFIEEGFKVFDADGNLKEKVDDNVIGEAEYLDALKNLSDCMIYEIKKQDNEYTISIDTEDHTYQIKVTGEHDIEEWDRFFQKD